MDRRVSDERRLAPACFYQDGGGRKKGAAEKPEDVRRPGSHHPWHLCFDEIIFFFLFASMPGKAGQNLNS